MKKFRLLLAIVVGLVMVAGVSLTVAQQAGDKLVEVFHKDVEPPVDLLPEGVEIVKGFKPGAGPPIGRIEMVQGKGWIVHEDATVAYKTKKGLSLFTGDMLVTGERSRIQAKMNDMSVFSLAPYSDIVIDRSVYDPTKDQRDSMVSLMFGKARFVVSKLSGGYDDDYKVKTPTATCGVRGSDFALSVIPKGEATVSRRSWLASLNFVSEAHAFVPGALATTLVTGANTTVGFAGVVGPMQIVGPMSASFAITGGAAAGAVAVSAAAVAGAMNVVGPGLAAMSMPPSFD